MKISLKFEVKNQNVQISKKFKEFRAFKYWIRSLAGDMIDVSYFLRIIFRSNFFIFLADFSGHPASVLTGTTRHMFIIFNFHIIFSKINNQLVFDLLCI